MHNSIISGHLGRKKTLEKLLQRFFWYGVREDVYMWIIKLRDVCATIKPLHKVPRAPLGKMQVGATLDRVSTDPYQLRHAATATYLSLRTTLLNGSK